MRLTVQNLLDDTNLSACAPNCLSLWTRAMRSRLAIAVIDHYDSFTYNLVELLTRLGAEVRVWTHDVVSERDILRTRPDGVLLSPGPGHPSQAQLALNLIAKYGDSIPFLGVCLGHQVLGLSQGATIASATTARSPGVIGRQSR